MAKKILVAGATGNLGERVINALLKRGAEVRAVVRSGSDIAKLNKLEKLGVKIYKVNMSDAEEIVNACIGVSCVVSTLQGLHEVIVGTQKLLLDAALSAGVRRFIPSDYSIDFTRFPPGENRNLDLRRDFNKCLDQTSISATSILNGAFTELLTSQMPLILFKRKRILYWGDADQRMDFTTMDDTAAFTSLAALDESTPRILRIAGDQVSARELAVIVSEVTGKKFSLLRAGSLGMLGMFIRLARTIAPGKNDIFPAWQGMQYMHNMFKGLAKLEPLDNNRYPDINWSTIRDVLTAHQAK